mmetsp:Transcript_20013/g.52074  ORF Transcript_20013/g.52074 Transcript_20013/m.52074 type:complete len:83 (+) Transcript_20013:13-261(+)
MMGMPGILPGMGGLSMPGMPPLMGHQPQQQSQLQQHQQQHHQGADVSMPSLMGMPQLPGLSGPMHPGLLMQLGMFGGMPGLQ